MPQNHTAHSPASPALQKVPRQIPDHVAFEADKGFKYELNDVAIDAGLKKGSPLVEGVNAALANISEEERQQLMEDAIANQPAAE